MCDSRFSIGFVRVHSPLLARRPDPVTGETSVVTGAFLLGMDQLEIVQYITNAFDGVEVVEASGDHYFFADPDGTSDPSRRLPFATIMTSDAYDQFSNLDRPSVFRLNVGVSRDTFRTLISSASTANQAGEEQQPGYDFTALDQILPHPVYGNMFWICVLNPSETTFATVRPLLAEAYAVALARHQKTRSRTQRTSPEN